MNTLTLIIAILQEAAAAAAPFLEGIPEGKAADAAAESLLKIIQAALAARQQVTGQPIDLSLLHSIDPIA